MRILPGFRFEIDSEVVQHIAPQFPSDRFEGIDFSHSGETMAVASSQSVLLFRRKPNGCFEDAPFQIIDGFDYPHDVAFSKSAGSELLAVAQRAGSLSIYEKRGSYGDYGAEPAFEISSPQSKLAYSDGISFVPPHDNYLAACNLELGTILFFRRKSRSPVGFEQIPEFELKHSNLVEPDGLAFSHCGRWLASANHGDQSVTIFARSRNHSGGKSIYEAEPISVIRDPQFRYPHSLAFTPQTGHLVVSNAGANGFAVYEPRRHFFGMRWSQSPVAQVVTHDDRSFKEVNRANQREGGPKGVAIHQNNLAICSPEIGVKIFSFRERRWLFRRNRLVSRYSPATLQRIDALTRFDMRDQSMPNEWYDLERHLHGTFRWTGPRPRATIGLPIIFDRDFTVRIHILSAINEEAIKTFKLSVHRREIGFSLDRLADGTFLAVARLDRAALAKPKRHFGITIEIANTAQKADDPGGQRDVRKLGLCVNWVELEPN